MRSSERLAPLRDVGNPVKAQPWDPDEIQAALREAFLRGILPESLFYRGSDVGAPRLAAARPAAC